MTTVNLHWNVAEDIELIFNDRYTSTDTDGGDDSISDDEWDDGPEDGSVPLL